MTKFRVGPGSGDKEEQKRKKEYVARSRAAGIPRKTAERNYREYRRQQSERLEREHLKDEDA
jgi:hypothetical protein